MNISGCDYPDSLLYDAGAGTWAKAEGNKVRVGVTPALSWLSGGLTSITLKPAGSSVLANQSLGSIEGPKHFDIVRAPFNCAVAETNSRLLSEPKLMNKDPFGEGWFAIIRQTGNDSRLLPLGQAADTIKANLVRLGIRCFAEFPDMELFEIGTECSAVIVKLDELTKTIPPGTAIHLVSDDPTSEIELVRWETTTGNRVVDSRTEANLHHFIIKKS